MSLVTIQVNVAACSSSSSRWCSGGGKVVAAVLVVVIVKESPVCSRVEHTVRESTSWGKGGNKKKSSF